MEMQCGLIKTSISILCLQGSYLLDEGRHSSKADHEMFVSNVPEGVAPVKF